MDPADELLERWQTQGDREALDQLLQLEIQALARQLRSKVGGSLRPSVSASDLAQEAVVRFLKRETPPQFDHPRQLSTYLWRSAWRLFLNRVGSSAPAMGRVTRGDTSALDQVMHTTGGFSSIENEERSVALKLALNLLSPEDQDVLTLVYFQHKKTPEAAEALNISVGAAEMRLTRARRRLAMKLADWAELID